MGLVPIESAFFARASAALSASELSRLTAAWGLAKRAHSGQLRQSGEPYVTHPLAVAELVFELIEPDADALCSALLHDVVEDSATSLASIESTFGLQVAHIVDGVSKLDRVGESSAGSAKEETLRKLVSAGGRDWRVFAVKLCDRLHNMRTLGAVSLEKRRRVAAETYSVFFPLARYVGFHRVATELESWSLRSLYPMRWKVVTRWCHYKLDVDMRRLSGVFQGFFPVSTDAGSAAGVRIMHETMLRGFRRLREDRAYRALFSIPTIFAIRFLTPTDESATCMQNLFLFLPASVRTPLRAWFRRRCCLVDAA